MSSSSLTAVGIVYAIAGAIGAVVVGLAAGEVCELSTLGVECHRNGGRVIGVILGMLLVVTVTAVPLFSLAWLQDQQLATQRDMRELRRAFDQATKLLTRIDEATNPKAADVGGDQHRSAVEVAAGGISPPVTTSLPEPQSRHEQHLQVAGINRHQVLEAVAAAMANASMDVSVDLRWADQDVVAEVISAAVRMAADNGIRLDFEGCNDDTVGTIRHVASTYSMMTIELSGGRVAVRSLPAV